MKIKLFSIILCVLAISFNGSLKAVKPIYLDNNQPIEARAKDALSKMTLDGIVKLCTAQSKFSSHEMPRLGIPEL